MTALLLAHLPLALLFAALKLALYLARKIRFLPGRPVRWGRSALRLAAGFALPLVAGLADPARWAAWALAGTAVGELVDRAAFYTELRVPTPDGHMAESLADLLRGVDGSSTSERPGSAKPFLVPQTPRPVARPTRRP